MTPQTTQSTRDYDKFKILDTNRDIIPRHVRSISKSIGEYGNFTKNVPIIVNENYEIIDGQHRFEACKALGEEIFFTVVPGLTWEDAVAMNRIHRTWTPFDYAKSYAVQGNKPYIDFLRYYETYGFQAGTIISAMLGVSHDIGGHLSGPRQFRSGGLTNDLPGHAEKLLGMLSEVQEILGHCTRPQLMAFLRVFQAKEYDHKQMLHKLRMYGSNMQKFAGIQDNARQIEEIYNFHNAEENHVRLF